MNAPRRGSGRDAADRVAPACRLPRRRPARGATTAASALGVRTPHTRRTSPSPPVKPAAQTHPSGAGNPLVPTRPPSPAGDSPHDHPLCRRNGLSAAAFWFPSQSP